MRATDERRRRRLLVGHTASIDDLTPTAPPPNINHVIQYINHADYSRVRSNLGPCNTRNRSMSAALVLRFRVSYDLLSLFKSLHPGP